MSKRDQSDRKRPDSKRGHRAKSATIARKAQRNAKAAARNAQ